MAEIKWIKITTDMFDDEKIDFISSLPEGDSLTVVWIRLLTMAGKNNAGGFIFLTENIPYNEDMLSHKFKKPLNVIKLALKTFKELDMIEFDENGRLIISNWEKHQNIEALDKIRAQTKARVNKHRELKQLQCNVTVTNDVTPINATDKELDKDKDKDKYIHLFDSFWELYPKKISKKDAVKAWKKIKLNDDLLNNIMNGLTLAIKSVGWVKDNGQFIPNAATWLNGERWNDEVEEAQTELFVNKRKLSKADQDMEELGRVMAEYDRRNAEKNNGFVSSQLS